MVSESKKSIEAIQALRALAVSYVVLDHAFPHLIPGGYIGVDIFFVISGFLITSHLLVNVFNGSFMFGEFYLRRARRLLPAALLVIMISGLVSIIILPPAWIYSSMVEFAAASLYFVNWVLAESSVNYFSGDTASPVRHYWSLSVEEQFYIIWPAIIVVCYKCGKRWGGPINAVLFAMAVMIIASLSFSSFAIKNHPEQSYFVTHGRVWEFGLGAMSALLIFKLKDFNFRLFGPTIFLISWGALIISAWAYDPSSGVPGPIALPVVLATCFILIIGDGHKLTIAGKILSLSPIQWLGNISYSVYLWHWPVLVIAPFALAIDNLSIVDRLVCLAITIILASLTWKFVENKFRNINTKRKDNTCRYSSFTWRGIGIMLGLSAAVSIAFYSVSRWQEHKSISVARELYNLSLHPDECFGARSTEFREQCNKSHELTDEAYSLQTWETQVSTLPNGNICQNERGDSRVITCSFGVSKMEARSRIAMLGDSHVGMWAAAIGQFAIEERLHVVGYLASSCPATDSYNSFAVYLPEEYHDACRDWRQAASQDIINDTAIDTVFVSGNAYATKLWDGDKWSIDTGEGFASLWQKFITAGKKVVVVEDVPMLPWSLPECLAKPSTGVSRCVYARSAEVGSTPLGAAVRLLPENSVRYIDLTEVFCNDAFCQTIIGGIPAYMDYDHISAPFSRSLADKLRMSFH